jgi:hypothetical protein
MFKLDLNLDDKNEVDAFLAEFTPSDPDAPKKVAAKYKLTGSKGGILAFALWEYAQVRKEAFTLRKAGDIIQAMSKECRCDTMYCRTIAPLCESW